MIQRLCSKVGKHSKRLIEAICLQQSCKGDRLLCFFCVFETHSNHNIIFFHEELNDHQISSSKSKGKFTKKDIQFADRKLKHITNACSQIPKIIDKSIKTIVDNFTQKYRQFSELTKANNFEDIIKQLNTKTITDERIQKIVLILKSSPNNRFLEPIAIKKRFQSITDQILFKVRSANQKFIQFINQFQTDLQKYQFIFFDSLPYDSKGNQQKIDKDQGNKISQLQKEDLMLNAFKNERKQRKRSGDLFEQEKPKKKRKLQFETKDKIRQLIEPEALIEQKSVNQSSQSDINLINNVIKPIKEQVNIFLQPELQDGQIIEPKINFKQINNNWASLHLNDQIQYSDQSWNPFKKIELPSKNLNTRLIGKQRLKQKIEANLTSKIVHIYAKDTIELNKSLQKISPKSIRQLFIHCDIKRGIIDLESAELIGKMKYLTSLHINWAYGIHHSLIIYILKDLHDLTQLCLADFNDINFKLIQCLKINNYKLKRLYLVNDFVKNLHFCQNDFEFLTDIPNHLILEEMMFALVNSLPYLDNYQIYDPLRLQQWITLIKRLTSNTLKEISITQFQRPSHIKLDFTPLIEVLARCNSITAIRLESIQFQENTFIELLRNNSNLKTIVISECNCLTSKTYDFLTKNCKKLTQLSLTIDYGFKGKNLGELYQLETLILRGCSKIKPRFIKSQIKCLKKLKCLSLNFCEYWMTQNIIQEISTLQKLQILNLSNNQLSNQSMKSLKDCKGLKTLICNGNNFNYFRQKQNCKYSKSLTKLSIQNYQNQNSMSDQEGHQKNFQIQDLSTIHPNLTHLKLTGFNNIGLKTFTGLPSLSNIVLLNCEYKDNIDEVKAQFKNKEIEFDIS